MHKFNHIRQVAPMCPHERIHCRQPANTIELSVYGGDAPYVKLLRPLYLWTRPQTAERFEPNTVLEAFHTIQSSSSSYCDVCSTCLS